MINKKPNIQYIKVSADGVPIQIEFNGTNYNLFIAFEFIGTIEEHDIHRWTNGAQLEHVTGWGLY